MRTECEFVIRDTSVSEPKIFEFRTYLRRDIDRTDVSLSRRERNPKSRKWKPPERRRQVAIKDTNLYYRVRAGRKSAPEGILSVEQGDTRADVVSGGPLDGFFLGSDGKSIAELLQSPNVQLNDGGVVMISGQRCRQVTATTPYGRIDVWLSVKQGYVPLQIIFTKSSSDLWNGGKTLAADKFEDKLPVSRWKAVVSNIVLSKVGDLYLAARGKVSLTRELPNGRKYSQEVYLSRSDFELAPDYVQDSDAFVFDLPEGTEVINQLPSAAGRRFIWEAGEVREGVPPLKLAKHASKWPQLVDGWGWVEYGMVAFNLVVAGIVLRYWLARQKSGSQSLQSGES